MISFQVADHGADYLFRGTCFTPARDSLQRQVRADLHDMCVGPHNYSRPVKLSGRQRAHGLMEVEVLVPVFLKGPEDRLVSRGTDSADLLADPALILPDHQRRGLAHRSAASIVAGEENTGGARKILHELLHDHRRTSPKAVNALVVVAHNKKPLSGREHLQDLILLMVDVLKFIHQDRPELTLPVLAHFRIALKKARALGYHIVKIKIPVFLQKGVVISLHRLCLLLPVKG